MSETEGSRKRLEEAHPNVGMNYAWAPLKTKHWHCASALHAPKPHQHLWHMCTECAYRLARHLCLSTRVQTARQKSEGWGATLGGLIAKKSGRELLRVSG